MKVIAAKVFLVEIGGRRPVLVQAFTDEGMSGVGEAAVAYGVGATAAAGMVTELAGRFLLGRDPFRIEEIWSEMYDHTFWAKGGGPIVFAGLSAIEQALWDIKGKALGVPVYELLGGMCRERARVYANGWSFRCVTPEEFAREAERVVADGYTALKLYPLASPDTSDPHGFLRHVSRRSLDREGENLAVARVGAVREAVGPEALEALLDIGGHARAVARRALGGKVHLIAALGHHLPDLGLAVLVARGRVDVVDPQVDRAADHGGRLGIRQEVVLHPAEGEDAHLESGPAQGAFWDCVHIR